MWVLKESTFVHIFVTLHCPSIQLFMALLLLLLFLLFHSSASASITFPFFCFCCLPSLFAFSSKIRKVHEKKKPTECQDHPFSDHRVNIFSSASASSTFCTSSSSSSSSSSSYTASSSESTHLLLFIPKQMYTYFSSPFEKQR